MGNPEDSQGRLGKINHPPLKNPTNQLCKLLRGFVSSLPPRSLTVKDVKAPERGPSNWKGSSSKHNFQFFF